MAYSGLPVLQPETPFAHVRGSQRFYHRLQYLMRRPRPLGRWAFFRRFGWAFSHRCGCRCGKRCGKVREKGRGVWVWGRCGSRHLLQYPNSRGEHVGRHMRVTRCGLDVGVTQPIPDDHEAHPPRHCQPRGARVAATMQDKILVVLQAHVLLSLEPRIAQMVAPYRPRQGMFKDALGSSG